MLAQLCKFFNANPPFLQKVEHIRFKSNFVHTLPLYIYLSHLYILMIALSCTGVNTFLYNRTMKKFEDFKSWLIYKMNETGLGINQLATYIEISPSAISKLRAGERTPSPKTIQRFAKYFKTDEDWLLALAGHRHPTEEENPLAKVIQDKDVAVWFNTDNMRRISTKTQRMIARIIEEELSEDQ